MDNPFMLSFGIIPYQYISRPQVSKTIIDAFTSETPSTFAYMITGIRGCGKTVLLTEIGKYLHEREDWIVVEVNPEVNVAEDLVSKLYNLEQIHPFFLEAKIDLGFSGTGVSLGSAPVRPSYDVILEKMLMVLKKKQKRLLISIDEVVSNRNIKAFAHSFQIFLRKEYRIFLLMTGLYENLYELQNEKTLTFLYRTPRVQLTPLDLSKAADIYRESLAISSSEAIRMAVLTKGYAFAFQVLGFLKWGSKDKPLEDILSEFDHQLADYVYDKIWSELTETDKRILSCIKEKGSKVKYIREQIGMTSSLFSSYREKLLRKGLVDDSKYGELSLVLPRFSEYMAKKLEMESF